MPIIRVEMFEGRNRDQKRKIIREVTDDSVEQQGQMQKPSMLF